jgi:hypothetical protein
LPCWNSCHTMASSFERTPVPGIIVYQNMVNIYPLF